MDRPDTKPPTPEPQEATVRALRPDRMPSDKFSRRKFLASLGALSAGTTACAVGPARGATAAPADTGELQSVVVTATRRREDIKDVPTSVSAIDADALAGHHVVSYDDLTRAVPGVSFQAGASAGLGVESVWRRILARPAAPRSRSASRA